MDFLDCVLMGCTTLLEGHATEKLSCSRVKKPGQTKTGHTFLRRRASDVCEKCSAFGVEKVTLGK